MVRFLKSTLSLGGYVRQTLKDRQIINVFLVHPKGMTLGTLRQYSIRVSALVNSALLIKKDRRVGIVTTAAADYTACARNREWDSWISSVIPRYQVFILVSPTLGKASRDLVELALQGKRPVRLLTSNGFIPVTGIQEINKEDWVSGWQAMT
jgi:hypothetical protein